MRKGRPSGRPFRMDCVRFLLGTDRWIVPRDRSGLCSTSSSDKGVVVGLIEVVAVIFGAAALVYLVYSMINPDRI